MSFFFVEATTLELSRYRNREIQFNPLSVEDMEGMLLDQENLNLLCSAYAKRVDGDGLPLYQGVIHIRLVDDEQAQQAQIDQEQATDTTGISGEIQRLETRLAGAQYSTGDLGQYRDLLRLAQYYNFQNNFTEAEKRYRTALDIQKKVMPDDVGNLGFLERRFLFKGSRFRIFNRGDGGNVQLSLSDLRDIPGQG